MQLKYQGILQYFGYFCVSAHETILLRIFIVFSKAAVPSIKTEQQLEEFILMVETFCTVTMGLYKSFLNTLLVAAL